MAQPQVQVQQAYAPLPSHSSGEIDDLGALTHLNADTLLGELKTRYGKDIIYTYVNDILVAVNPFKRLPIYTKENMELYRGKTLKDLPPHVFAISDSCFHSMLSMKKNQCAVISGESGAGKTESAKFVINHIIELCRSGTYGANLEQQILEVSPLLEAFGNAKTTMNNNSSRFGKYTRLLFDAQGGVMGVQLSEYLLERARVVEQHAGERNFHVFYYIFASENLAKYLLSPDTKYKILGGEMWANNAEMYQQLRQAMQTIGFGDEEEDQFFRILAACIHLGNVDIAGEEVASFVDGPHLAHAATLLDVPVDRLTTALLGTNTITRGETIRRLFTRAQASDAKDALIKALYGSLFGWIVTSINEMLAPELHQKRLAGGRPGRALAAAPALEIGVLDIFGFENFTTNGFEQICINLAHEQLQFFFNRHHFSQELEAYVAEGVDATKVTFRDNEPLLKIFLERPIGLLSLLDEESSFPKATDVTFVDKLNHHFKDCAEFVVTMRSRGYPSFGIKHFAAEVEYNATSFLEKNRDNLAGDVVDLMQESGVTVVQDVFLGEILNTGQIRPRAHQADAPRFHRGKAVNTTVSKVNRKPPTLSQQFKNSLAILIERMNACYPHFIRCIKPNGVQASENFQDDMVRTQLSYTGVLEATRIRQEGYAWRPTFAEFVSRYKLLAFPLSKIKLVQENSRTAKRIIEFAALENFMVGHTRLFLKYYHLDQMEAALRKYYATVLSTQCLIRGYFARRQLARLKERARMNAAERAAAEQRDAEERARLEAIRLEREAEQAREADEEAAQLAEQERLRREKEEADVRAQEQLRHTEELESQKQAAERARQEAEAQALAKIKAAEEAHAAKKKAEEEAERARKQREEALRLAELALQRAEETEVQVDQLAREAEEARSAKEQSEKEAQRHRVERQKSRKKRQEDSQRLAQEAAERAEEEAELADQARRAKEKADEEARKAEEARQAQLRLTREEKEKQMLEHIRRIEEEAAKTKAFAEEQSRIAAEAMAAKEAADEIARRAEEEHRQEEARVAEEHAAEEAELTAADFRRPEFKLDERIQTLIDMPVPAELHVDHRTVKGWLLKIGQHRKSWKRRWFVMDLNSMVLHYFENEKEKKEKGSIPLEMVLRCYTPSEQKKQNLFMVETLQRTYFMQATSPEAMRAWVAAISVVPLFNDFQQPGRLNSHT